MNLIETYNGSGFYAQYSTSADYDSLGNPLSSYMVESKFGFNNNLITGYNGSGFALSGYFYDKDGKVGTVIIRYNLENNTATVNGTTLSPTDCVTLVQNNPNVILRTFTSGNDGIEEGANFYPANFYDNGATITFTSQNVTDGTDIGNLNVIASRNGNWERHSYSANYTMIS